MVNTTERSKILLLCLGLDSDKAEVKKLGVKELQMLFGEFGHLAKVIVFTRKVLLKAFLEYDDFAGAEKAKNALHEKFVKNYGKARLYFSPMQEIKYSNKYIEFWEDTNGSKGNHSNIDNSTNASLIKPGSNNSNKLIFRKNSLKAAFMNIHPESNNQSFSNSTDRRVTKESNVAPSTREINAFNAQSCLFTALNQDEKQYESKTCYNYLKSSNKKQKEAKTTKLSKVILVSNLANVFKNADEIFNLFSSFGNIVKILMMKNLQKALIEYTEIHFASEAITNTNNLSLGETRLRVNYSKYKTIDLLRNNQSENSMQFNEVIVVPPIKDRYKSTPNPIINPISSTLLVSFPKIGNVQTLDIYLYIERICRPIKTRLVNNKSLIGKCEVVNMLFSFQNIESAVYVMYKSHNSIVKGTLLDVFFF